MAINFEAANMAGYNNPKIEVFEAIMADDGASLASYPPKSVILNCLSSGSIPFIMLTNSAHDQIYLMPLSSAIQGQPPSLHSLTFSTIIDGGDNTNTVITVYYPEEGSPTPFFKGIPA